MPEQSWGPAEQWVPELLNDLMLMGAVEHEGRVIQQYKHCDTRRYLNLDGAGQAWEVAVHPDSGESGIRRVELADAKVRLLS